MSEHPDDSSENSPIGKNRLNKMLFSWQSQMQGLSLVRET